MIVLEEIAAKSHRPVGQTKGMPAPRTVIRSARAGCSPINPKSVRENTTPFAEDFYWEHSLASVSVVLRTIPNSLGPVEPATRRNQHGTKFGSLSCVYMG